MGSGRRLLGGCCWRAWSGWLGSGGGPAREARRERLAELSALDARVLRATDARYERSPERIGSWRVARQMWRSRRCAGFAAPVWLRMMASVRSGGCARIAATWRWSTRRERRGAARSGRAGDERRAARTVAVLRGAGVASGAPGRVPRKRRC